MRLLMVAAPGGSKGTQGARRFAGPAPGSYVFES
jgi:hypothetical protein